MLVNKTIKATLKEISAQAVAYGNTKDEEHKYYKRMADVFTDVLTEDERIFLAKHIFTSLHYRSVVIDPETLMTISNMKIRTIFSSILFGSTMLGLLIYLFFKDGVFSGAPEAIGAFFKLLSL